MYTQLTLKKKKCCSWKTSWLFSFPDSATWDGKKYNKCNYTVSLSGVFCKQKGLFRKHYFSLHLPLLFLSGNTQWTCFLLSSSGTTHSAKLEHCSLIEEKSLTLVRVCLYLNIKAKKPFSQICAQQLVVSDTNPENEKHDFYPYFLYTNLALKKTKPKKLWYLFNNRL